MGELGDVDGKLDAALRTGKAGKAVRDIENGLAADAGELDLGRIDALRLHAHHLRRKHLRKLALRAAEFRHPCRHRQDPVAAGTSHLAAPGKRGTRRRRWLPHGFPSLAAAFGWKMRVTFQSQRGISLSFFLLRGFLRFLLRGSRCAFRARFWLSCSGFIGRKRGG